MQEKADAANRVVRATKREPRPPAICLMAQRGDVAALRNHLEERTSEATGDLGRAVPADEANSNGDTRAITRTVQTTAPR